MGYYCLPIEPSVARQQDFPTKLCWVLITKDYPKPSPRDGKKKLTKEQTDEYNQMISKRNKMVKTLESGHYNCFNSPINGNDIMSESNIMFDDSKYYIYRIKPTSSNAYKTDRYSNTMEYKVYEFDVLNRCDTKEELLSQLNKDNNLVEFMREVLDKGKYTNNGYHDTCIKWFKYCYENFLTFKMGLKDIVFSKYNSYETYARYDKDENNMEKLILEMIDMELINIWKEEYGYHTDVFSALIHSNWFELADKYIHYLIDNNIYDNISDEIKSSKEFEVIKSTLKINSENEHVKNIIKTLNYVEECVTLKVFKDSDYDYDDKLIETKEFKTIVDVRSYLIKQYNVPFDVASGDITELYFEDEHYNSYKFIVE